MGIQTIGALAATDPAYLKTLLKKQGEVLWGFANGIDLSPVVAEAPANKGYGNSTTIPFDVSDTDTAFRVFLPKDYLECLNYIQSLVDSFHFAGA